MRMSLAILLLITSCVSCAINPPNYDSMSVGQVCKHGRGDPNGSLAPAAKSELESRSVFSDREWRAITDRKIFVGISENALTCSWTMV